MSHPRFPLLALLLAAAPALAQIAPSSPARQRAANRQALRDARHTEADYQSTHLRVTRRELKQGASQTSQAAAPHEPRFGRDGQPHVTEPRFPGLRRRQPAE